MGILAIASTILGLVAPYVPSIVKLVQGAHPVPPDAPAAVKADINNLKASGANQLLSVLVNQFATAGSLPANASDPSVQAMLAGAIEQAYQGMKAKGELGPADVTPAAPVGVGVIQPLNLPDGSKWTVTLVRL